MKSGRFWAWLTFGVGAAYFFIPLIATLEFSMRMRRGVYSFDAYRIMLGDLRFSGLLPIRWWSPASRSCSAC
jgi:putative spermidine/putrescine transport system permease protein